MPGGLPGGGGMGGFGIDWCIMIASNIEEIMKLKRIKRQNHTLTQSDLL